MRLFDREPALFLGVTGALINVLVEFGVDLTPRQVSALNVLIIAVISLIVRHKVTPVENDL